MSTARITVNVDEETSLNASMIFDELGLDMSTAINSFLKTVVREKRIPYELSLSEPYGSFVSQEYIAEALRKSKAQASDPNTKWMSYEEIAANIKLREEARNHGI